MWEIDFKFVEKAGRGKRCVCGVLEEAKGRGIIPRCKKLPASWCEAHKAVSSVLCGRGLAVQSGYIEQEPRYPSLCLLKGRCLWPGCCSSESPYSCALPATNSSDHTIRARSGDLFFFFHCLASFQCHLLAGSNRKVVTRGKLVALGNVVPRLSAIEESMVKAGVGLRDNRSVTGIWAHRALQHNHLSLTLEQLNPFWPSCHLLSRI